MSVPHLRPYGIDWKPALPWWGPALNRQPLEVDVVAESADGRSILVGAAKWENRTDVQRVLAELAAHAALLPFVQGRAVYTSLWLKGGRPPRTRHDTAILGPDEVLSSLR